MSCGADLIIKVVLADDHSLVRQGLHGMLCSAGDIVVLGEARDGQQLLELLQQHPVNVAVIDLGMPGLSGIDLIRRIKTDHPNVAVLVVSMHTEEQRVRQVLRAGASGYLAKDGAAEDLVPAVRKVARGGSALTTSIAERLATGLSGSNGAPEAPLHSRLSRRELEVLRLIVGGQRLTQIAEDLQLSVKTVSTHKTRILEKMELDSTAALIKYALANRIIDGEVPT